nr:MAG TPA: hypothetical protein [Caudoviricetes sp.]DAO67248.1 MAG TPA: hypothetical protein [Caudoviricetes sp.]
MRILIQLICSLIVVCLLELIEKESKLAAFIIGLIMVIVLLVLCILELLGVISF